MSAVLLPNGKQQYLTATGAPAVGYKLYTYNTGTLINRTTWQDAGQTTPNANPIILDARGEAVIFWSGGYRAVLKDSLDNQIWSVDGVSDQNYTDVQLRADLASTTSGSDGSRLVGYRSTLASSIARTLFQKLSEYISVADFGTNTTPGTTDCTAMIQAAITAGAALGVPAYLPASMGDCKITAPLTISSSRSGLVGNGRGFSRITALNCHAFTVAAGISFPQVRDVSIAQSTRYTTAPNAFTAIKCNGTTASSINYATFDGLFIDGFETAIDATGVRDSEITGNISVFGKNGIVATQLVTSLNIHHNDFSGGGIAGSVGVRIGDGTAASEGCWIDHNVLFGFAVGIDGFASAFCHAVGNIIDQTTQFGILLRSSVGGCGAWNVVGNTILMIGAIADTGIYLTNNVANSSGADSGHNIQGNRVVKYVGATLTNGLLCDGAQDKNHRLIGNSLYGDTFDCRLATGTGWEVIGNRWANTGFSSVVQVVYGPNFGTNLTVNTTSGFTIDGSAVFDPPNLVDGTGTSTTVTVTGAVLGDFVAVSFSLDLQSITVTGYVSSANTVTVRFQNESGGAIDLASGTLRARVSKL